MNEINLKLISVFWLLNKSSIISLHSFWTAIDNAVLSKLFADNFIKLL